MEKFLYDKIAIVTGGTRGIGRAIASSLLQAGASVAICGRSQDAVNQAVDGLTRETNGKVLGKVADVSSSEDVRDFFQFVDEKFGSLDILVNNAGIGRFASLADLSLEDWHSTLGTNLSGVFYCCHEGLPRLRKRGGGYLINISSLAGKNAFAGGAAYNASKFGLNGFSEAIMQDHRYDNIRVSYIMPGSVATEFGSGSAADWKIAPEDIAEVVIAMMKMPSRTLMSCVEVRPAKAPKK